MSTEATDMAFIRSAAEKIVPAAKAAQMAAEERLNQLTKPPGSLGRLEALAVQLAGAMGTPELPGRLRKAVVVMAADHGVCEEGVSAFPQQVTRQMVANFLNGGAAINVLARQAGADVVCVDMGVKGPEIVHEKLLSRRVREGGTANLARGPAMTREEAVRAIRAGMDVANDLSMKGYNVLATGEMGIGNTTASSALLAALTGLDAEEVVGRGTGIGDEGLRLKRETVARALELNRPDPQDPVDALAKVGGLEIAGLAGLVVGAASMGIPVVIDGFISSVAALAACRIAEGVKPYLIPSHLSSERGHKRTLEELGLAPMLQLEMRLGEGTGAALAFPLIDAACGILREMATFESAGVSKG